MNLKKIFVNDSAKKKIKDGGVDRKSLKDEGWNGNFWRNVPDAFFLWHGAWLDPEVFYKGRTFNEPELEESLYLWYEDRCKSEGVEPTEEGFDEFANQEAEDVLEEAYDSGLYENWESYDFDIVLYDEDGEEIETIRANDLYPELNDVYDDITANSYASSILENFEKQYGKDYNYDSAEVVINAHEYDMGMDDFNGNVRWVNSPYKW